MIATTSSGSGDTAISSDITRDVDKIDYTHKSETLTFAEGEVSKTFSVNTKKDDRVESDETFTVTLASESNATVSSRTVKGTILSDEIPAFEVLNATAEESGTGNVEMTFTVTLSSGATQDESVSYTAENGTAKAGIDFIAPIPGRDPLEFASGEQIKTFAIDIIDNDIFEIDETFTVQLSGNSSRTALINNGRATGTISDDDDFAESTISVAATSTTVDEGQDVQFSFNATPELARPLPITITLAETGDFLAADHQHKQVLHYKLILQQQMHILNHLLQLQ